MDNWHDIYLRTNNKHAELLSEAKQSRMLDNGSTHRNLVVIAFILIGLIAWWVG